MVGSMMPTLILGFLQGAVAIWTGSFPIFILAIVLMIGGGGDFLVDHPTELGFVSFEKAA